jgi:signal transduction histidine kinase/ActR/RegA family two-component response regulator
MAITEHRVLFVDSDPESAVPAVLEENERFDLVTATGPDEGLARLEAHEVECIVSAYDLTEGDGIAFLDAVREAHPSVPFVLYTDSGSEEIASRAISAGVTDYLRRETDGPAVLADHVQTLVGHGSDSPGGGRPAHRAASDIERENELFREAQAMASVGAWEYDTERGDTTWTPELYDIFDLPETFEPAPEKTIEFVHLDYRDRMRSAFSQAYDEGEPYDIEVKIVTADGDRRWVRTRGEPQTANGTVVRVRGTIHDSTERKRQEQDLERQNRRLEEFASVVSHDLRNPLTVAMSRLELAQDDCESEHLGHIARAHERMETLISDLLILAREGGNVTDIEPVELAALAESCWETVETADATLVVDIDRIVRADESHLRQVFENLVRNAVEHGGEDVTITLGELSGREGFYVEDDGPGIPPGERDEVFEAGYSTVHTGTGFGLSIARQMIEAHGWQIDVTAGTDGGARFEITGVEFE